MHDIDELSSGEKEVLYGYLRLRNSAPRNSVILLDEPELHLNPSLLQGLADFYHRNLGRAMNNQLWLVTHSDTLLRQSVGNPNYSVFHMMLGSAVPRGVNQAVPVLAEDELERATIDLVGDLATYKPRRTVVIFEGGGDTEFDVTMTSRLFPELEARVNLISGGSRRRVRDLYEVLEKTAEEIGVNRTFFAVVDRDLAPEPRPEGTRVLSWNCYHIENYLLDARYVAAAARALLGKPLLEDEAEVLAALTEDAQEVLPRIVLQQLQRVVNHRLVGAIAVGAPPDTTMPARDLLASITSSATRFSKAVNDLTEGRTLEEIEQDFVDRLELALKTGDWRTEFPGRLVLARFVSKRIPGVSYSAFRNLVLDQMVDDDHKPAGMREVVDTILGAE